MKEEDLYFPSALEWMWTYCIYLGGFTDSDGENYDLGVFVDERGDVSSAIVYGNIPGDYMSGELIRNGKDRIMFKNEMTIETLKRYREK
jgi:hypothetical protein